MNLQQELKIAKEATKEAGEKVMEIYNTDYDSFEKGDGCPVTEADLESEEIILPKLQQFDYKILSEETKDDQTRLEQEKVWIVDPLDGTQDFLDKTGEFAIMIGLVFRGSPVLGVVYQPVAEKLYHAMQGQGAYLNGEKLEASSVSELNESKFIVSRSHLDENTDKFLKEANPKGKILMGSAGLKIGAIAEGKAEAYITTNTYQWDSCAPQAILEEAGGQVTNLYGKELEYNREEVKNTNGVIASNAEIHRKIVDNWGK